MSFCHAFRFRFATNFVRAFVANGVRIFVFVVALLRAARLRSAHRAVSSSDFSARRCSAGKGVHSSSAIMMSAPSCCWISITLSGVSISGALTPEQQRKLLDVGGKCPVHHTLKSGIDIRMARAAPPP